MKPDTRRSQLFTNISHELRTPLTLIMAPLERLLADAQPPEQRRELELMAQNARMLSKQVDELMQVARMDHGPLPPRYASCDLAELMRVSSACFQGLARVRRIRFAVKLPLQLHVEVDPEAIHRAINNLLSNAFEFTPEGGVIRCELRDEGDHARIEIADSGPGIPQQRRAEVFDRFRLDETAGGRRFGGLGLGLSIVKDTVEQHGGRVSIGDAAEGGALVTVRLPLKAPAGTALVPVALDFLDEAPAAARVVEDEMSGRTGAPLRPPAPGLPRVLVVEDTPAVRRLIAQVLSADYAIETASDGRDGLDKARTFRPDLIISDLMMPRLSGHELIAALARDGLADIPVVVVTANIDEATRLALFRAGAADYLPKPFSIEELRVRVRNHVKSKRARDMLQQQIRTQNVDIEVLAHEATLQRMALEHTLTSLETAKRAAEEAARVKSDFLGLVSHELRTPLTTLGLYIAQFERSKTPLAEDHRKVVTRLRESTARLCDLVDSLLEFNRIERGQLDIEDERVDLAGLVEAVLADLRPQAQRKGLTLSVQTPNDFPAVESDQRLIQLILGNLIGNAIKFTDTGGVEVRLEFDGALALVAVHDTGPGIAPTDLERIFEPFQHLEPLRGKHTPGFGLGLALVRQMARALGATLQVQSKLGQGTVFTVGFPLSRTSRSTSFVPTDQS